MSIDVLLRDVEESDLPIFFQQQIDPQANRMAAFTAPRDPSDWDAFLAHWNKIRSNNDILIKTILYDGHVAGNAVSFVISGEREVGYWIGKEYWGLGIATYALRKFLGFLQERPLYAHAAKDNAASLRVLEKNGFKIRGEGKLFSHARGEEVEEYVLILEGHIPKDQPLITVDSSTKTL